MINILSDTSPSVKKFSIFYCFLYSFALIPIHVIYFRFFVLLCRSLKFKKIKNSIYL